MDTLELLSCVEADPIVKELYGGVFPRDNLPSKIETFPRAYVANTDTGREPGKHWVAFYFENKHYAEFFDSYGNDPGYLAKEFESFLSRNVKDWIHNVVRLQGDFSTVCGQYCVLFLYYRCRGTSMSDIVRMFSKNTEVNDVLVNEFVNLTYDGDFPVMDVEQLIRQIAQPERSSRL